MDYQILVIFANVEGDNLINPVARAVVQNFASPVTLTTVPPNLCYIMLYYVRRITR